MLLDFPCGLPTPELLPRCRMGALPDLDRHIGPDFSAETRGRRGASATSIGARNRVHGAAARRAQAQRRPVSGGYPSKRRRARPVSEPRASALAGAVGAKVGFLLGAQQRGATPVPLRWSWRPSGCRSSRSVGEAVACGLLPAGCCLRVVACGLLPAGCCLRVVACGLLPASAARRRSACVRRASPVAACSWPWRRLRTPVRDGLPLGRRRRTARAPQPG